MTCKLQRFCCIWNMFKLSDYVWSIFFFKPNIKWVLRWNKLEFFFSDVLKDVKSPGPSQLHPSSIRAAWWKDSASSKWSVHACNLGEAGNEWKKWLEFQWNALQKFAKCVSPWRSNLLNHVKWHEHSNGGILCCVVPGSCSMKFELSQTKGADLVHTCPGLEISMVVTILHDLTCS